MAIETITKLDLDDDDVFEFCKHGPKTFRLEIFETAYNHVTKQDARVLRSTSYFSDKNLKDLITVCKTLLK